MNEIIKNSTSNMLSRTDILAAEINSIKNQTRRIMLYNSIEIGRRLTEAKQLLPHGEWGKWLEKSVDYSQSTANNLMRIFEEYGADQLTLLEDNAKSQALGNLSYTQAIALLGVPEQEREKFVEEHDIEKMSTRELQKAIKEREQALKEKEELEEKLKAAEEKFKEEEEANIQLEEIIDKHYTRTQELSKELEETKQQLLKAQGKDDVEETERLQTLLSETESELLNSQRKIEELEKQLNEKPKETMKETIIEKIPEKIEKELEELRRKAQDNTAALKFQLVFDDLSKKFREMLQTLKEIKETDTETYDKYSNAVSTLIKMMQERL